MAEFVKVMKDWRRMCKSYPRGCAEKCPLQNGSWGACQSGAVDSPERHERIVEEWAEKHPEPRYPTWAEWLEKEGIIYTVPASPGMEWRFCGDRVMTILSKGEKPIPDDIAKKLGIQPKEG